MCRLLAYLGSPIQLDQLLYQPEHSLIVQSYQPREMTAGLLNADGFGVGWYSSKGADLPYRYRNTLPIWSDVNLPNISRYVDSACVLAYVRSATLPESVEFNNCQPFSRDRLLFVHNGFINHFRETLYRPIRETLSDEVYSLIHGTTDSEHLFALVLDALVRSQNLSLLEALQQAMATLTDLAKAAKVYFSANIILSDGKQLVVSRYANRSPVPSLYWLAKDSGLGQGVIVASEPLFEGNWISIPEDNFLQVGTDLAVNLYPINFATCRRFDELSPANARLV